MLRIALDLFINVACLVLSKFPGEYNLEKIWYLPKIEWKFGHKKLQQKSIFYIFTSEETKTIRKLILLNTGYVLINHI